MLVEWGEVVSPIDAGQFLADNMVVEVCVTRPDGEQYGWLITVKADGEIKYYTFASLGYGSFWGSKPSSKSPL